MPIKSRTKRLVILAVLVVVCLLVAGFVFVSYFMHAVYEKEHALDGSDVPAAVTRDFAQRFPGATEVVWEHDDDLYEAEFTWQGQPQTEARYLADGTLSKTVRPISFADLPAPARAYLQAQAGYDVIEPERIDPAGGPPVYEAKLASKLMEWNCLFDAEGNLVDRTRDGPVLEE